MKIKILLATATAASVLMTAAGLAQNFNYIDQAGDFNDLLVDQSVGNGNHNGTGAEPLTQNGNNNDANISQANGSSLGTSGTGVDQNSNWNKLTVTQDQGSVDQITQNSVAAATSPTNVLKISQTLDGFAPSSHGNTIGTVTQTYNDATGAADENEATITQVRAAGNFAHPNSVVALSQHGTGNLANVTQTNARNILQAFTQSGDDNSATVQQDGFHNIINRIEQDGADNRITLLIDGDQNGGIADGAILDYARPYGHPSFNAAVRQVGNDNRAGLSIDGNNNGFAIFQDGNSNRALGLEIFGDGNQLAIGQYYGDLNTVTLAPVHGDSNVIALRQGLRSGGLGDYNEVTGSVDGSTNIAIVDQVGSVNDTTFNQTGDGNNLNILATGDGNVIDADQFDGNNVADVDVTGNDNALDIHQSQTGADANTMTVAVTGNNNNTVGAPSLNGDAGLTRGLIRVALGDNSFNRGDLVQEGSGNSLVLTVTGSQNSFATAQLGNGNIIEHTISGSGTGNQAVIGQTDNDNVSVTIQNGSNNNLGVFQ